MKNKLLQTLGLNIKIERIKKNYTQEKLAELSGVQMQHISKIENGECNIKFLTLISLLKGLDVPFDKLFDIRADV